MTDIVTVAGGPPAQAITRPIVPAPAAPTPVAPAPAASDPVVPDPQAPVPVPADPAGSARTPRRPDPRVVRSRAKVMAAATEVLRESGPGDLTIDEVVRRSGVARMTVYRHWPTRDDLLLDALRAVLADPAPALAAVSTDPVQRLTAAIVAYGREFARADWADVVPPLLHHAGRDPRVDGIREDFAAALGAPIRSLIGECVVSGAIGPVDPDAAVATLLGPLAYRRFVSGEPITAQVCLGVVRDFVAAHPAASRVAD